MALATLSHVRFNPGQVVMTQGVNDVVQRGVINPRQYLLRHLRGDWGDLCEEDRATNEAALKHGDRLMSSYPITATLKLWIITECDRSVTTLLLPEEY
ncbi:hypothetical protein [uncultured Porticoccus sp.]|uniref:hypothetical protein n=1 Tax=uncultured Porticoccus sp. TaxID=1256050 RepID=UPI0026323ABE|nr:hypothetical protein [uncultured Porticoccus sp.]